MKQVDEKIAGALKAEKMSPHFQIILQWFKDSLAEQRETNDAEKDDVTLRQGQGRALNMSDFLKEVDAASDTQKRIRQAPERHAQERERY